MTRWLAGRLLATLGTALAAFALVFLLLRAVPGDPVDIMLGERAAATEREALRGALGLDRPWPLALARDLAGLTRGDLGTSLWLRRPVAELVAERIGPTVALTLASLGLAWALALPLGVRAGWRPDSRLDRWSGRAAGLLHAIPSFALGPLLLWLVAVRLEWLPLGGYGSWSALVLPALTLGTGMAGFSLRLVRRQTAEARASTHVAAARARGAPEGRLRRLHALRPGLGPVVTLVGLQMGALLSGVVVVETVFRWPGLGRLLVQGVLARDYPLVQGLTVVFTAIVVLANLLADLVVAALDPRVRKVGG